MPTLTPAKVKQLMEQLMSRIEERFSTAAMQIAAKTAQARREAVIHDLAV